ncbi:MAG: hypothetical protein AB4368_05465 [Xenococcaceae cyanobacterium]
MEAYDDRSKELDYYFQTQVVHHAYLIILNDLLQGEIKNKIKIMDKTISKDNNLPKIGIEILSNFLAGIEITQLADIYHVNDEGIEEVIRQTLKGYFRKTQTSQLFSKSKNEN